MRELYTDEVLNLEAFLDLFLHPSKYGCRFDPGDLSTYQDRAGHIVDDARKCIEELRDRRWFHRPCGGKDIN